MITIKSFEFSEIGYNGHECLKHVFSSRRGYLCEGIRIIDKKKNMRRGRHQLLLKKQEKNIMFGLIEFVHFS